MDMFIEVVVFVLVAGDDVFALLICDEDLEYGARRFWCLLVGTLGKNFSWLFDCFGLCWFGFVVTVLVFCVKMCDVFLFC